LDGRTRWAVLTGDDDGSFGSRPELANYEKYFGNNSQDQYVIVEDNFLFILLNWNSVDGSVSKERLEWMDEIIQSHKGLRVVIGIHPYLFGFPILNLLMVPDADEIWRHIDKHENVIMTLSGHIHQSWVRIHVNGKNKVWSIATEDLMQNGYIRLFDVYEDRIEVYAYSPWANKMYTGTLDRFTIKLNPDNYDVDGDLWNDGSDVTPTHPFVPNGILGSMIVTVSILTYWIKNRKAKEPSPL